MKLIDERKTAVKILQISIFPEYKTLEDFDLSGNPH